jgi:hypothetical protein
VFMGPKTKLVNTVCPMYTQKLNLTEVKAISQKLCQTLAYTAMAGQFQVLRITLIIIMTLQGYILLGVRNADST